MNRLFYVLMAVAIVVSFSGCGNCSDSDSQSHVSSEWIDKDWIGKDVLVKFRGDALGDAAGAPIPSDPYSPTTTVSGDLLKVNADSIVVRSRIRFQSNEELAQWWIPKDVILMVELKRYIPSHESN